jgi:hypothetical protein
VSDEQIISKNEAMRRLLAMEETTPREWWERFNSTKESRESIARQEAAERRATEGVCRACGARTIDNRCGLCGGIA